MAPIDNHQPGPRKSLFISLVLVLIVVGILLLPPLLRINDSDPLSNDKQLGPNHSQNLPTLVTLLAQKGITSENTAKIVLQGSEGGFGSNITVEVDWEFLIQEIWDSVYQSRPYTTWCACGYRKAHFYSKTQDRDPVVTLCINATDRCHIQGQQADGYRCPKLHSILEKPLSKEFQRRRTTTHAPQQPQSPVRALCDNGQYHQAMRRLPKSMDDWDQYTALTGNTAEGAAGYEHASALMAIAEKGDAHWGRILDDPEIPYRYKTEMIFEILEARLGKGAVYVANSENLIIPRSGLIDLEKDMIDLPEP